MSIRGSGEFPSHEPTGQPGIPGFSSAGDTFRSRSFPNADTFLDGQQKPRRNLKHSTPSQRQPTLQPNLSEEAAPDRKTIRPASSQGGWMKFTKPSETFNPYEIGDERVFDSPLRILGDGDLGKVQLGGIRIQESSFRNKPSLGVTIKDGELVIRDAGQMEEENPNLFTLYLSLMPAVRLPEQYQLVCKASFDNTGKVYQTPLIDADTEFPENSHSSTLTWSSTDPNDTNEYEIMVNPQDANQLNLLSFSFAFVKKDQEIQQ